MSGHNKWSKVKHKKEASDKKKSKLFSVLSRQITLEAKKVSGNRESPSLRRAIEKARASNMPNDVIDRAIHKATDKDAGALENLLLEAYGPGGVAIIIEAISDNRNRTVAEIRHLLDIHGGNLSTPGSTTWAFMHEGDAWKPQNIIPLRDEEKNTLANLKEALGDHDDIDHIYTNGE
jgi:YebC/PmpR family DNA-binding regulatory protein